MDYTKFRYYKGESECPFPHDGFSDEDLCSCVYVYPRAYWWWAERMVLEHFRERFDSIERAIECWIWKGELSREWSLVISYVTGDKPSQDGGKFRYYKGETTCPFECDINIPREDWLVKYPKAYWWWAERESAQLAQEHKNVEYAIIDWIKRNWQISPKEGYPRYNQMTLAASYVNGNAPLIA